MLKKLSPKLQNNEDHLPIEPKGAKEEFARFFENPTRESLRDLLRNHTGETDHVDFKREWPAWPKVAQHILAMANSGGGAIFIGMQQKADNSYASIGVEMLKDKARLQQKLERFLPERVLFNVFDFAYEDSEYPQLVGKKFQVLLVEDTPSYIPFLSTSDGDGICKGDIYVRRGTQSIKANYEELQQIINRRIETTYTSSEEFALEEHLAELRVLYNQIPRYLEPFAHFSDSLRSGLGMMENPDYPDQTFTEFVKELIVVKRQIIRDILGAQAVE